jgi:hypothetical protein
MITATASFRIALGKNVEAMEYLAKVTRHIKDLTGSDYRILTRIAGPAGQVILATSHDSVAAWDAARSKIYADAAWQKMSADAGSAGLFLPGSVETALWQES